ncbi:MAG: hypothetical protein IKM94_02265 [Alphaproteobacteria bacterium]|nr:hypothetical protein [Alphaproteobacteria bacterium]
MQKYSIRELEILLLNPGIYSYMTAEKRANDFYNHRMNCDKWNNMAYKINGYKITKTLGGFVMLWFPDGTRCMNVFQPKLQKLFAKCAMFYIQQETGKVNNLLDGENVRVNQEGDGYKVIDTRYSGLLKNQFSVQKTGDMYHLYKGVVTHFDTEFIPQEYVRDLYADIQDVFILQNLVEKPIKSVQKNDASLEHHRNGFIYSYWSFGYDIQYADEPGIYTLRQSFQDIKNCAGEMVLPNGRIIYENRKIKDRLMTEITQRAKFLCK